MDQQQEPSWTARTKRPCGTKVRKWRRFFTAITCSERTKYIFTPMAEDDFGRLTRPDGKRIATKNALLLFAS